MHHRPPSRQGLVPVPVAVPLAVGPLLFAIASLQLAMPSSSITFPAIQVASTASANERFAARELHAYLGNMSSSPVRLVVGDAGAAAAVIAVGYDAAVALGVAAGDLKGLKNDSYVISSQKPGIPAGSFVITGGRDSQRGTGFAVYDFLRELGCSFLAFDYTMEEECPTPPASLPSIDRTYHPLFEYRDNNEWAAAEHPSCEYHGQRRQYARHGLALETTGGSGDSLPGPCAAAAVESVWTGRTLMRRTH